MNRRLVMAALGLLVLAGAALAFHAAQTPEPVWRGRSMRAWLKAYGNDRDAGEAALAGEALTGLGPQIHPYLLELLQARDSRLKTGLLRLQRLVPMDFGLRPARGRQALAAAVFRLQRHEAAPAIPALTRLLNDRLTAVAAAQALAGIGPEALPPLTAALVEPASEVRLAALNALRDATYRFEVPPADQRLIITAMTRCLNDPDPNVRYLAAVTLNSSNLPGRGNLAGNW